MTVDIEVGPTAVSLTAGLAAGDQVLLENQGPSEVRVAVSATVPNGTPRGHPLAPGGLAARLTLTVPSAGAVYGWRPDGQTGVVTRSPGIAVP